MYRIFFLAILLLVGVVATPVAHAVDVPGTANMLSIGLSPENPQPYGTVTITPQSTLLNLSEQTIQIFVNGAEIEKGTGSVSASTVLGAPGTATTIKIVATNSSGVASSAQTTLRPADVSLIVEPNTTSHPFYEGGLLVSPETPIRIIALTDFRNTAGTQLSPSSLIYTWKFGDRILESDSGIGRSTLSAIAPVKYRDADIILTVQSPDGNLVGQAHVTVSPVDPVVRLYQHDPLLGVLFNTVISNTFTMSGAEATFRAISYYFGSIPTYAWTVNSATSGAGTDLTVRANGSGKGTALLGVEGTDTSGNTVNTSLSVLFGNTASSGIFGL